MTLIFNNASTETGDHDKKHFNAILSTLLFAFDPRRSKDIHSVETLTHILCEMRGIKAIDSFLIPCLDHVSRLNTDNQSEYAAVFAPLAMALASTRFNTHPESRNADLIEECWETAAKLEGLFHSRNSSRASTISLSDALSHSRQIEATLAPPDQHIMRFLPAPKKGPDLNYAELSKIYLIDHSEDEVLELIQLAIVGQSPHLSDKERESLRELATAILFLNEVPVLGDAILSWIHWTKIKYSKTSTDKKKYFFFDPSKPGWLSDAYCARFWSYYAWLGYPYIREPDGQFGRMSEHLNIQLHGRFNNPRGIFKPVSLVEKELGRAAFRVSAAFHRVLGNHVPLCTQLNYNVHEHIKHACRFIDSSWTKASSFTQVSLGDMQRICDEIDKECKDYLIYYYGGERISNATPRSV